jgi:putative tricarboxylic transport membrane protein
MDQRSSGAIAVALGLVAVGLVVGYETTQIAMTPIYAKVGPKVFPYMVAGGLVLLGLVLLWQAWTGRWTAEDDDNAGPPDRRALGWLGFGLVFNVATIGVLGFILASTVLFASVARAFGSTRPGRDLAVALVFSAVCYFGFARVLGINMGAGLLERLI